MISTFYHPQKPILHSMSFSSVLILGFTSSENVWSQFENSDAFSTDVMSRIILRTTSTKILLKSINLRMKAVLILLLMEANVLL